MSDGRRHISLRFIWRQRCPEALPPDDQIFETRDTMSEFDADALEKDKAQAPTEAQDEADDGEIEDSIITLIDDEGRMSDFDVLDAIETDDGRFVALLPLASMDEETGDGEYIILRVDTVNGEEELAEIEDEKLVEALADLFQERFHELYETEDYLRE